MGDFAQLWSGNDYSEDAGGDLDDRVSVDLIAPGANISVVHVGGTVDDDDSGTSLAAPHVTGAVALLQQYAKHQITEAGWNDPNSRRHEVMKAILLNSADKLEGVHGSPRTLLNEQNQIWQNTTAYQSASVPLDKGFGAGHLNVRNAVTNFAPGEHDAGIVPTIGWDFSSISEGSTDYILDEAVGAGSWIAVTLAWDRIVTSSEVGDTYNSGTEFFNNPIEDELVNLDLYLLDGNDNIVHSSEATADSVEHIFWQIPEGGGGDFKIRVTNAGGASEWPEGYGLAWWAGEAAAPVPGDFDEDGDVDQDDLGDWKDGFGTDFDGSDFLVWQQNYGFGVPATPAAVPEPSALLLLALGLPLLVRRR